MRIGVNPLLWTNDDMPHLGDDIPLTQCLREAHSAGYLGIELGNKFPRDAQTLLPMLKAQELDLIGGWYSGHLLEQSVDEEWQAAQKQLELLKAAKSETFIYCECTGSIHGTQSSPLSQRPILDNEQWTQLTTRLNEFATRIQNAGLTLAYHHHMGTVIQTADDIDRLLSTTRPAVGLLLDTGHLGFAGADPTKIAQRFGSRIAHVHLKDLRATALHDALAHDVSFLDAVLGNVFTVPGDGGIDFEALFQSLSRSRYDGWLVIEADQDPNKAIPLVYAQMGYENTVAFLYNSPLWEQTC